jgi:hypothetical protein
VAETSIPSTASSPPNNRTITPKIGEKPPL